MPQHHERALLVHDLGATAGGLYFMHAAFLWLAQSSIAFSFLLTTWMQQHGGSMQEVDNLESTASKGCKHRGSPFARHRALAQQRTPTP
eukprot:1158371-Pelagomonas_calceolata.AAC.16